MRLKSYIMTEEKKAKKFKFEQAIADLESIVTSLDSGEMSLEDMLKEFERGIKLVRDCQKFLATAQKKVETLIAEEGKLEIKDLESEAGPGGKEKVD
jgi:exodeoxyribonuclease VII small subunit